LKPVCEWNDARRSSFFHSREKAQKTQNPQARRHGLFESVRDTAFAIYLAGGILAIF